MHSVKSPKKKAVADRLSLIITWLDDLREQDNLRFCHMLPVAFAWQEKNNRAHDGLAGGLEDGTFCDFVTML